MRLIRCLCLALTLASCTTVVHVTEENNITVTQLVGPEGGTVELTGGGKVVIPPGALDRTTSITVSEIDRDDVADLPDNLAPAGKPFAFKPHGTVFAQPVKIEVPFDGDASEVRPIKLPNETRDSQWTTVFPSDKDVDNHKLSFNTTSFSVYMAARPRRTSGVITLPDGAVVEDAGMAPTDSGTDALMDSGGTAGVGGSAGFAGVGGVGGFVDAGRDTDAGAAGAGGSGSDLATRFPTVTDWNALELVYPTSHSGYDGVHVFRVPMRVRCTTGLPLSAWHSDPATAVIFDTDPNNANGVIATILEPVAVITIAAISGTLAGTAPLHVTVGTPAQWELGNQRFNNGADWTLNLAMATLPPPDTRCSSCHGANSSTGFDILVTPTQIARVSDNALTQIMATGTKPADVAFRVLPATMMFGTRTYTNTEMYEIFHLWDATADQRAGMNLYQRSLTPAGQGCVVDHQTGMCVDVAGDPQVECGQ